MTNKEFKTLQIEVFRDKNKLPTCSIGPNPLQTCPFYQTARFGTIEYCSFIGDDLYRRGKNGLGSLEPDSNCPLWTKEELSD